MNAFRPIAGFATVGLIVTISVIPAAAAVRTWTGSGDWSNPGNWSGGVGPGPDDDVVFDAISTNNAVVDATFGGAVQSVTVTFNYTGIITQNRDLLVGGDFTQSNGVWRFTAGTAAELRVDGGLTVGATLECQRTATDGGGAGRVIIVGGNLMLTAEGTLDARGMGFNPGNHNGTYNPLAGPGQGLRSARTDPRRGSGGGHGGEGGRCSDNTPQPGGSSYGSLTHPLTLGSGGGDYNPQVSYGGGAIALRVDGDLVCDGWINANATTNRNSWGGAGAGGSVLITCREFTGAGRITANGGQADTSYAGGGAGGRIAIHYTNTIFSGELSAIGGSGYGRGAAGTIYLKPADPDPGTLLIDNAGQITTATTLISSNVTDVNVGHVMIRNAGHLRIFTNQTLTVHGGWTNNASFSSHPGGTVVLASDREATIAGNSPFHNLTCTRAGKRIVFDAGSTTTVANILVLTGADGNPIRLASTTADPWYLVVDDQSHDIRYVDVQSSDAAGGAPVVAFDSLDSGGNHNWIFAAPDQTITWLGTDDSDWANGANWDLGRPAIYSDTVIIAGAGAHAAVLDYAKRMRGLHIRPGAIMSLGGYDLTVFGDVRVEGTLAATASETGTVTGNLDLSGGTMTAANSTLVMGGCNAQALTSGGNPFYRLTVTNTSATITFRDAMTAAVIDHQNGHLRFRRAVTVDVFDNKRGSLRFDASLAAVDFDARVGPATMIFNAGSEYRITNLYLYGAAGEIITLRSSVPGVPWSLEAIHCRYVAYVDVQDSDAGGGAAIVALNSIDGGNNLNWTFVPPGVSLTWTGAVSGEFGHPGNWSPALVPGPTNIILLDGRQVHAPVISTPWSVSNLFVGGPLPVVLTVNAPLAINGDLAVLEGGVLTHTRNHNTPLYRLAATVTGDLLLDGAIDVDGKGYAPTLGPGPGISSDANGPRRGSGGGHGGEGGRCSDTTTPKPGGGPYGSITQPTSLGSGGGWGHYNPQVGYGGGAIAMTVAGSLVCDGVITAGGATNQNNWGGGGGGGSIHLVCLDFRGTGSIRANGGNANTQYSGAGAGGRIAIETTNSTFSGMITALGGNAYGKGAAGTVYMKPADRTYGSLLIDNQGIATVSRTLVSTNVSDALVGDVTIQNQARLAIGTNQILTVYGSWANAAGFSSAAGGTVFFAGTESSVIWGSNTFHHLAIGDPDIKPVVFEAGKRQTVLGHLTVHDAILESTIAGSQWQLRMVDPLTDAEIWPRHPRVTGVAVRDSDASSGETIYAYWHRGRPSVDRGNNLNWIFRQPKGATLAIR